MKVILGLSGGIDSASLCAYYLAQGHQVIAVNFNYGSKHNRYEREAAYKLANYFGLAKPLQIDLPFIYELFKSNLLLGGGPIPEGDYRDATMAKTVVPARNLIFISIMTGIAWSMGATIVAYGAHSGDHAIYEDCRPEFVYATGMAVRNGTGNRVMLEAPFINFTKSDILKIGNSCVPSVPWELTRTCYKDQVNSCGKCGSCRERLEAFQLIGMKDPVKYEDEAEKGIRRVPRY